MRKLTLNEKITIKGALEVRGISGLPKLDTKSALHYWYMASNKSLSSLIV